MSILSKVAKFARSPQGRRAAQKAQQFVKSPEGKRKIAQVRERVGGRTKSR